MLCHTAMTFTTNSLGANVVQQVFFLSFSLCLRANCAEENPSTTTTFIMAISQRLFSIWGKVVSASCFLAFHKKAQTN